MPDHPGSVVIECGCGAGLIDDTLEAVAARWNQRFSPEPVADVAELKRLLRDMKSMFTSRVHPLTCCCNICERYRALVDGIPETKVENA